MFPCQIWLKTLTYGSDRPQASIFFKFFASRMTTLNLPDVGTYRKEKQMSPSFSLSWTILLPQILNGMMISVQFINALQMTSILLLTKMFLYPRFNKIYLDHIKPIGILISNLVFVWFLEYYWKQKTSCVTLKIDQKWQGSTRFRPQIIQTPQGFLHFERNLACFLLPIIFKKSYINQIS